MCRLFRFRIKKCRSGVFGTYCCGGHTVKSMLLAASLLANFFFITRCHQSLNIAHVSWTVTCPVSDDSCLFTTCLSLQVPSVNSLSLSPSMCVCWLLATGQLVTCITVHCPLSSDIGLKDWPMTNGILLVHLMKLRWLEWEITCAKRERERERERERAKCMYEGLSCVSTLFAGEQFAQSGHTHLPWGLEEEGRRR